ncbi:MAG: VPLPA-CTERM sorting domain-containing protein [Desulfamplus sp.]|nr:VPLPA-CTERM sorting domain-containing protein [Desulfamplus sp.]
MKKNLIAIMAIGVFMFGMLSTVEAATIGWTDWTSKTAGNPGSAAGTITLPDGKSVNVSYTGELFNAGDQGNWNQYETTYTKPGVVDNLPNQNLVSIQLKGGNAILNTITFSTPLVNPVMAIQSLGSGDTAKYSFNQSFEILKQGKGHWGGGVTSLSQSGNNLIGNEGNGIIQFTGTYSSISWTVPDGENYHMFTVGAPSAAVPVPAAIWLLGSGLAGLIVTKRRAKK